MLEIKFKNISHYRIRFLRLPDGDLTRDQLINMLKENLFTEPVAQHITKERQSNTIKMISYFEDGDFTEEIVGEVEYSFPLFYRGINVKLCNPERSLRLTQKAKP